MDSNKKPVEANFNMEELDADELSFEEADQVSGACCELQLFEV